mgnify:CR=1 FL=1
MRPDLHHLLLSQVDETKLKDLEFQFLHRSTVSKLRLDHLLNQNRGFLQSVPIHLACIESFQEKKKKARLPNEFVDCGYGGYHPSPSMSGIPVHAPEAGGAINRSGSFPNL